MYNTTNYNVTRYITQYPQCHLHHSLFFFGTLEASLLPSGFIVVLGSRSPQVVFYRLFFRFVTPVGVRERWLASDGGCLVLLPFLPLCMLDSVLLLPLLTDHLAFASAGVTSLDTSCHVMSHWPFCCLYWLTWATSGWL